MNDPAWILSNAFLVAGLTTVTLGFILVFFLRRINNRDRYFFTMLFAILILYLSSKLISFYLISNGYSETVTIVRISTYFYNLFGSLAMPMLTHLICSSLPDRRKKSAITLVSCIWLLYFALLTGAQFTTCIFSFPEDRLYVRGPYYPVLLVMPAVIMILNIVLIYIKRDNLSAGQKTAYTLFTLLPLICIFLQMFMSDLPVTAIGTAFSSLFMFIFIINRHTDSTIRQANENAEQKASILALQMRPHFIYNTLTSIYYLIEQDPEKAQSTIIDFTNYLRKNFNAIASGEPVAFEYELEHARTYLAVELVRFPDKITVDYDIPFTKFRLPPLTLEPLVENAVKHGMDPESDEPLYIAIRTQNDGYRIRLTVENSGEEFGAVSNDEPHIALDNIRQRLDSMCRGTLNLFPREGGGTIVTIDIPDSNK